MPLRSDPTFEDVVEAVNRLFQILRGNLGGQVYLYGSDGIKRSIRGGAVVSSGNFALKVLSDAGLHFDVRNSGDTASLFRVEDAGVFISGSLNVSTSTPGSRFLADFDVPTLANRFMFQTNANATSTVGVLPGPTTTTAGWAAYNNPAPDSATVGAVMQATSTAMELKAESPGSSFMPMDFYTNATQRLRLTTDTKIQAVWSGALASRLNFQSIGVNAITGIGVMPNGTATQGSLNMFNASNLAATSFLTLAALSADVRLESGHVGASYLPFTFWNNGAEKMRLDATGNLGVGGTAPAGSRVYATGGLIEAAAGIKNSQHVILTGAISPAQIAANTDNYNPTGLSTARILRLSTDASRNLTGIVAQTAGTLLSICNVGAFDLVLVHDATSTAANRFVLAGSVNLTLTPNKSITVFYDTTSSRWRQLTA